MRGTLCGNRARRSLGVFVAFICGGKRWSRALPTFRGRAACDCDNTVSARCLCTQSDPHEERAILVCYHMRPEMRDADFAGHRLDRRPFITPRRRLGSAWIFSSFCDQM
jgi:hypothetical protein